MGLYGKIQGKRNFTSLNAVYINTFGLGKKLNRNGFLSLCPFFCLQGDQGVPGLPGFLVSLTFVIHLVISETEQSGMKR